MFGMSTRMGIYSRVWFLGTQHTPLSASLAALSWSTAYTYRPGYILERSVLGDNLLGTLANLEWPSLDCACL